MEEFDNVIAILDEIVNVVKRVAVRVRWFCVATFLGFCHFEHVLDKQMQPVWTASLEVAWKEPRLQELPRLLVCVGVVGDDVGEWCVFVADDHAFKVASNEFMIVPLLTSRHGLKEQAASKRNSHAVDNKIVLDVVPSIGCQAHSCTTQMQIKLGMALVQESWIELLAWRQQTFVETQRTDGVLHVQVFDMLKRSARCVIV